jgi:DNA-binding CsgD family transcriptional regulator
MQSWALSDGPTHLTQRAMAATIGAIGCPHFASTTLSHLREAFGASSWSVYQLHAGCKPAMHFSASAGVPDTTAACFAIYRDDGLYRRDCSFDAVRALPQPETALMLRMHADEAPSAVHREAIYRRHGLAERLSVACREGDGSLLAVNLYCHEPANEFGGAVLERFAGAAPALLAAVRRHILWQSRQRVGAAMDRRTTLATRCPQLTTRELDVLEYLLDGLTYDGIASVLELSVATVKTYRARAFARLGMHFKSELFAAFAAMPRRHAR